MKVWLTQAGVPERVTEVWRRQHCSGARLL